jgi:hypothetical protein
MNNATGKVTTRFKRKLKCSKVSANKTYWTVLLRDTDGITVRRKGGLQEISRKDKKYLYSVGIYYVLYDVL